MLQANRAQNVFLLVVPVLAGVDSFSPGEDPVVAAIAFARYGDGQRHVVVLLPGASGQLCRKSSLACMPLAMLPQLVAAPRIMRGLASTKNLTDVLNWALGWAGLGEKQRHADLGGAEEVERLLHQVRCGQAAAASQAPC